MNRSGSSSASSSEDYKLELFDRLNIIRDTVQKWGEENFYISFSGGKDSTVLSALIDEALPNNKIPRVYFNTGIEYNLIVDFVKAKAEKDGRVQIVNSGINLRKLWEEKGYPFKSKKHSKIVESYRNHGFIPHVERYAKGQRPDGTHSEFGCPVSLRYQFTDECNLKISAKCCDVLKKQVAHDYEEQSGKHISIRGVRMAEDGLRSLHPDCAVYDKDMNLRAFNAINPVSDEFIEWYIWENDIEICDIYYPPYNAKRTGCKGCPYDIHLQDTLDMMQKYLPNEYKQCELLWQPVYSEYRRLNYRLCRVDQATLFD